jgi:hypothetical protein
MPTHLPHHELIEWNQRMGGTAGPVTPSSGRGVLVGKVTLITLAGPAD